MIPTYPNSTRQVKIRRFGIVSPTDAKVDLKDMVCPFPTGWIWLFDVCLIQEMTL